jgi:hypothetical protein
MKENPKTNFVLLNKLNTEDDNDYNVILSMSNEIYIKEFDKILKINNINSVVYDSKTKTQNYDNKIEYTLVEKNIEHVETPVVETPVVETPVVETPVVETPVVEKTPVVETTVVETPVVETPVVEKKYRLKLSKKKSEEKTLLNLLENDTPQFSSETSVIEDKIQYHLELITSSTDNNIIFIITNLVKFIDNFPIEGINKKNIIISVIKKFLSHENNSKYLRDNQWEEHQSDDGQTYWWNNITDVSTWTKPIVQTSNIDYIINNICSPLIDILISVDKRKIVLKKNSSCCFVS